MYGEAYIATRDGVKYRYRFLRILAFFGGIGIGIGLGVFQPIPIPIADNNLYMCLYKCLYIHIHLYRFLSYAPKITTFGQYICWVTLITNLEYPPSHPQHTYSDLTFM